MKCATLRSLFPDETQSLQIRLSPIDVQFDHGIAEQVYKGEAFTEYLNQAARLCWFMALQRPQMTFKLAEEKVIWEDGMEKSFEIAWGSTKGHEAEIKYNLNPMLMHGKRMMARGKVFIDTEWGNLSQDDF